LGIIEHFQSLDAPDIGMGILLENFGAERTAQRQQPFALSDPGEAFSSLTN